MRALLNLVCEGLTEDQHTHQFTAFKIVGAVYPKTLPVRLHRLAYLVVFDHEGPDMQARVDLQATQDGELLQQSAVELLFGEQTRSQAAWILDGLTIPKAGTLHITALHQGRELASYPLRVHAPPAPAAPEPSPPPPTRKRRAKRDEA